MRIPVPSYFYTRIQHTLTIIYVHYLSTQLPTIIDLNREISIKKLFSLDNTFFIVLFLITSIELHTDNMGILVFFTIVIYY